ncbi:MAG: energy transducer TonB [Pseudomonadota bacterium]
MMRFGGQYGLMLVLAIVPTGALAKDKSEPAHVLGNAGSFFGADAYPPEAIRAEEQGRSVAKVAIDANGIATGCTTAVSSGSASLDATTCSIAMTKLHYVAARDSRGRAVAGSYTLPVRWVLPVEEPQDQQAVITFSGTAAAPVCSVTVSQVARHIVPAKCRAIANVILSHGGNLSQSVPIGMPNEADLSPLGE